MTIERIYCDAAATTPVDQTVIDAMLPYMTSSFANPASVHTEGKQALTTVDTAREAIAQLLHCAPQDIIFTSGATESNNLLLQSIADSSNTANKTGATSERTSVPHIVTTALEHSSILKTCHHLEKHGHITLSVVSGTQNGTIRIDDIEQQLRPETRLVTVMFANNETGAIQPIRQIGRRIRTINKQRDKEGLRPIMFHSDATQAWNSEECDMDHLLVDAMTLSGHKVYGPKGIGILARKPTINIRRILHGGGQEYELRAGTLNVPGIIGITEALKNAAVARATYKQSLTRLRQRFIEEITQSIPSITINSAEHSIPNIVNVTFHNRDGEILLYKLDEQGVAASMGSACSAGALQVSPTLIGCGISEEDAQSSIRFSFLKTISEADLMAVVKRLKNITEAQR